MPRQYQWIGVALLLPLLGCASVLPASTSLSGSAWLDQGDGGTDLLRGLTVHLCKPEEASFFQFTAAGEIFPIDQRFRMLDDDLDRTEAFAHNPTRCTHQTTTDTNGKFQINAPAGEYLVVAVQRSPNLLAAWITPTTIDSSITLNLTNANATHLLKK